MGLIDARMPHTLDTGITRECLAFIDCTQSASVVRARGRLRAKYDVPHMWVPFCGPYVGCSKPRGDIQWDRVLPEPFNQGVGITGIVILCHGQRDTSVASHQLHPRPDENPLT